jgi:hypothetical protein
VGDAGTVLKTTDAGATWAFTSVKVSSNGRLDFVTNNEAAPTNKCLPAPPHQGPYDYTIFPYWDDLRTEKHWSGCSQYGGRCGIFTSVSGAAPHRILNIEFRAVYAANTSQIAHFEVRLYEGQARFDVIYGAVNRGKSSATAGVQRSDTNFTQYFCNGAGSAATGGQQYVLSTTASTYDFNHNGKPDYVLYNGGTRQTAVWYLNNNVMADSRFGPTLPAGWKLVDVADFNGDGDLDYALFNPSTPNGNPVSFRANVYQKRLWSKSPQRLGIGWDPPISTSTAIPIICFTTAARAKRRCTI